MFDRRRLFLVHAVWILLGSLCAAAVAAPAGIHSTPMAISSIIGDGSYRSDYRRSDEVQTRCKSTGSDGDGAGSSASLSVEDGPNPRWALESEISFENGNWEQEAGGSPLMPFDPENDVEIAADPLHLSSFWITDVDLKKERNPKALKVSGILELAILGFHTGVGYKSNTEEFQHSQGLSRQTLLMEGIYTETESDRSICMLGCTVLLQRGSNTSNPWPAPQDKSPPTKRSCNFMLQLHYPREMSLKTRAIHGVLKSLSNNEGWDYFDPISLVSQLGAYTNYQFKDGALVEEACKDAPPIATSAEIYRGNRFCAAAMQLLNGQMLDPSPSWKCNRSEEYCTNADPFKGKAKVSVPRNGSQILIQDIRCIDSGNGNLSSETSNISAFFRLVPPSQNPNTVYAMSGLDGLTLVAEGVWTKSSGKLCMVACRGSTVDCQFRVCLYIPTAISIAQRDMIIGTISSLDEDAAHSFNPLSFHLPLSPHVLPNDMRNIRYKYTKINNAGAMLEREEPLGLSDKIRLSLLKYPATGSYNSLSEDLSLNTAIIPWTLPKDALSQSYLDFTIIAIEDFVATDWTHVSNISVEEGIEAAEDLQRRPGHVGPEEEAEYVRVAAQLRIMGLERVPLTSAEGLYNPKTGKMYLVGCRQVSVPWKVLQNYSFDLVDGLDCNVELTLQYPPKNSQWLVNPTVSLTITSTRTVDDPFFSPQVTLQTFPVLYQQQREEIVSRKSLEGGLSMLTLSLIIVCIASQLMYIRKNRDPVPFISLVMLGVQAIGYGIPLIIGAEALFAKLFSGRSETKFSVLQDGEWTQVIMYLVKLLILVVFLLNLRLCQKVVKARIRLGTRCPLEPGRVPSDKKILLIFLLTHVIGFLLVFAIHTLHRSHDQVKMRLYDGSRRNDREWANEMREYGGLMQDLFLLPQVLGGAIWDVSGKPLRRIYYIGLTVLRMLPHAYDALRAPVFNPYFLDEYVYANPKFDFYSRAGDIAIPLLALVLAVMVYVQQRWNGVKWGKVIRTGSNKMMRYGSRIYQRLPSKLFEAELMPSIPASTLVDVSENGHAHPQESSS